MSEDWIKSYRKTRHKGWYKKSQYVHLWGHLLYKASYIETEFFWNGKTIRLKPGQFITGRKKLSEETGINESMVERILKLFEKEGQIEQQKTNKYRLITVLNWGRYQNTEQPVNNKRTTDEQPVNTFNKDKELKKEKNNTPLQVRAFAQLWNDTFKGSPIPTLRNPNKLSKTRKGKINTRLKEESDLEYWKELFEKILKLPFYLGQNDRGWVLEFNWLIDNDTRHVGIYEKKIQVKQPEQQLQNPAHQKYRAESEESRE